MRTFEEVEAGSTPLAFSKTCLLRVITIIALWRGLVSSLAWT